jgi:hypothetical protein
MFPPSKRSESFRQSIGAHDPWITLKSQLILLSRRYSDYPMAASLNYSQTCKQHDLKCSEVTK